MYAFLNSQLITLALLAIALIALLWGYFIREPFVANSPVRRGLKRARMRDKAALVFVAAAILVNAFVTL